MKWEENAREIRLQDCQEHVFHARVTCVCGDSRAGSLSAGLHNDLVKNCFSVRNHYSPEQLSGCEI